MTMAGLLSSHFSLSQNAEFCLRILVACACGAVIGIERSRRFKEAGVRTHVIVCAAAALVMVVSKYGFADLFGQDGNFSGTRGADPARIAAQVITGVGFLGAGAIIQMKGSVRGLTTAAGIWMTACIGLAVGAGMYLISIITTLLIIFILVNIERLEQRYNFLWESKIIRGKVHGILDDIQPIRDIIESNDIHISDEFMKYDYDAPHTIVNFMVRSKNSVNVPGMFNAIKERSNAISITITNEMNM